MVRNRLFTVSLVSAVISAVAILVLLLSTGLLGLETALPLAVLSAVVIGGLSWACALDSADREQNQQRELGAHDPAPRR